MLYSSDVLESPPPDDFLGGDEFVDFETPLVRGLARALRRQSDGAVAFATSAFEWVRDTVAHSYDACDPRVTLTSGEVLEHRVGLC